MLIKSWEEGNKKCSCKDKLNYKDKNSKWSKNSISKTKINGNKNKIKSIKIMK